MGCPTRRPWTKLRTPVGRILSTSFSSVSIFSVCCYSTVSISVLKTVQITLVNSLFGLCTRTVHTELFLNKYKKCVAVPSLVDYKSILKEKNQCRYTHNVRSISCNLRQPIGRKDQFRIRPAQCEPRFCLACFRKFMGSKN
jgi:hypothetical protein